MSITVQDYDDLVLKQEQMLSEKGKFAVMPSEEIVKKYISKKTTRSRFEDTIVKEANFPVLKYILSHLDLRKINKILLTYSHDLSSGNLVKNVKYITRINNVRAVVDLKKVNNNKNLNQYFYGINDILPGAGIYFGCVETHRQRNKRIHAEKKKFVAVLLVFFEFIFHRVLPKTGLFRGLYLKITGGRTPVLSLAETLGRLVYNGFDIIEYKAIRNMIYFVVMKTRKPTLEKRLHSDLFIKQQKTRKNGETKFKYRVRTRHIYSEYLPDYVLKLNASGRSGMAVKDFRYNIIGRLLFDWTGILLGYVQLFGEYLKSIRLFPKIELEDIFYIKHSLGKRGKLITIYKFRTMVRNADKMDNLIIQYNSYGNPVKDPRIIPFGRFMRKIWIDELPQLFSILKGDIKIVGIRPMRESDWERYPKDLKEKALRFKPGLMGVQYATLRKDDFEEHTRFFHRYLDMKEHKPFLTDLYFFFRILYYIFFKGVRSD